MLVERGPQLGELVAAAADAFAGRGRLILLGGEAGVGKSALVRALADEIRGRAPIRVGGADNVTTAEPLAAFQDAFPELAPRLGEDRVRLFRAIREVLAAGPSLLVLEDLHWADEATLDALRFLGRRLDGVPALIVASYRHDEVGARHPLTGVLGDLAGAPGVSRMPLPPLTAAGVAELAAGTGSAVDPVALFARTGGNAFFVTEVLAAGGESGSVRDAVLARAARLSAGAADVLAAAAVVGTASAPDVLAAVAGRTLAAVDECVERGMLVEQGAEVGFRHELARQSIEESLSGVRRRQLHQRALRVLGERTPDDHRALAHHAAGCGDRPAALRHATRAAERAARLGAHREAAAQYRIALRAASGVERAALYDALSYECYLTDQPPEAITARQQALELHQLAGDRLRVGDAERWLSRLSWFVGRGADAERYARRAVATLEPVGDSHELAMALSNLSQLRMLAGDNAAAEEQGGRAIELAERLGDREVLCHALNNVGTAVVGAGRIAEGTALQQRSLEVALADDRHEHAARAYTNLGSAAVDQRRFADAAHWLAAGIAYTEERDLDTWTFYMLGQQAIALAELGRWDQALAVTERMFANLDLAPVSEIAAATVAARIAARRGGDGAVLAAHAVLLAEGTGELQRIAPAACAVAELLWLSGRADEIAAATDRAWALVLEHPDPWRRGELAWWRSLAGLPTDAEGCAEPFALMLEGRPDEAAAAWRDFGCVGWEANALGLSPSSDQAQRGVALLAPLGAAQFVEALLRTRRDRGLPLPRRPRAATRANIGELTARELDVLRLLAEGLSSAEIADRLVLSTRTVEHHVGAILRKLGEPSRARAVAEARRLGLAV